MKTVTKYIYNQVAANKLDLNDAKTMLKELQDRSSDGGKDIAIIGLACRFANADSPEEFWDKLINQADCIGEFPSGREQQCREILKKSLKARMLFYDPGEEKSDESIYVKGGYLPEIDKFDAAFFRIPPREAMHMDPVQRVFLETAYEAMEDAGYGGANLMGAKVGVFAGRDHAQPTMYNHVTEPDDMKLTGSYTGILASRIGYIFNFKGPSVVIDTACSSGLVAVHEACRALANKECELAIAGGIQIQLFPIMKNGYSTMSMLESHDERVRTFDKDATGTLWGEGAGVVVLKPLEKAMTDHDHIHAVIKGSAVINCGASSGITAPTVEAQKEVMIKAWKEAKIDPETISYIEAHSMGTSLGDPIEVKGITAAFLEYTTKKQFCGIGSVKTNLGHLVAASGLASLIKVVLALKNQEIPPLINFRSPNPYINFVDSPVYVHDSSRPWKAAEGSPRRAGVGAFGFSGTNCHVVLEEAPAAVRQKILPAPNQPGILTLTARNQNSLRELIKRYSAFLERAAEKDLGDICYTANTGRGHYSWRIALIIDGMADLRNKLTILNNSNWSELREPGIYFGTYVIVPEHKKKREANELTESERKQLTVAAGQKLKEYLATESGPYLSPEFTAELCLLYVRGAEIAWNELYKKDHGFMKLSLPVYPLERIPVWAPPHTISIDGLRIGNRIVRLVDGEYQLYQDDGSQRQPAGTSESTERQYKEAQVTGLAGYAETETAYILAQIWARVLGVREISVDRSFYDMGGDSLLASQLFKEIDKEYPNVLSTADMLSNSTVIELAKVIDEKGGASKQRRTIPETDPINEHPVTEAPVTVVNGETSSSGAAGQPMSFPPKKRERFPDIYKIEDLWSTEKVFQRDEPEAKELVLHLQRDITIALHRCLPLQIVLSDEKLYPWFYERYVNIFSQIQADGMIKLDYLEEFGNFRLVIHEVSLSDVQMQEQKDIIAFIIENINRGNYLNICVDEYYLPRKMRSGKTHFIYHELVYGYDNEKQELKTIGFNVENIIDRLTFTYDEFRNAYEQGKAYYRESAPWTSQGAVELFSGNLFDRQYPFMIKNFLDRLASYLHSTPEKGIIYYWSLKDEQVEYGFKVHDLVLEYMEKLLHGIVQMDYRALHLLYEHKNGLAKRFAYIIKLYGLTGKIIQLNDAYLEVVKTFQEIRLKYLDLENRFSYRTPKPEEMVYAQEQLVQMMGMIKAGMEREYAILAEILQILEPLR